MNGWDYMFPTISPYQEDRADHSRHEADRVTFRVTRYFSGAGLWSSEMYKVTIVPGNWNIYHAIYRKWDDKLMVTNPLDRISVLYIDEGYNSLTLIISQSFVSSTERKGPLVFAFGRDIPLE